MAAAVPKIRWRVTAIEKERPTWCVPLPNRSSVGDLVRAVEIRENMLRQEAGEPGIIVGIQLRLDGDLCAVHPSDLLLDLVPEQSKETMFVAIRKGGRDAVAATLAPSCAAAAAVGAAATAAAGGAGVGSSSGVLAGRGRGAAGSAAPSASALPTPAAPGGASSLPKVSGRKRFGASVEKMKPREGGPASTTKMKTEGGGAALPAHAAAAGGDAPLPADVEAERSGDKNAAPPHRDESAEMAAAAPSAVVKEKGAMATGCNDGEGAGCDGGVPGAAGAAPSVVQEIIAIECSEGEEDGNGDININATDNDGKSNGKSNDAGDKTDKFVADGPIVPAPSVGSDLQAKAVADVSFAFSAFAGGGNPHGFAMARTRRGAVIQRIQQTRVNPLAKCNMTEKWQCAHSLALTAAVQFGGTPSQKKLTEAFLTDLCTEDKEVDKEVFSRLVGRLKSTAREDGMGGVLLDDEKLVEVCECEATLKQYMLGVVEIGKSEETVKKCVLGDNNFNSTRDQLRWNFNLLLRHCEVRDEYRSHECYLETWCEEESDTEESETDEFVKKEAAEQGCDRTGHKKRRYTKAKGVDILRWNRAFQKHPPGPISSFLAGSTPGV